MLQNTDTTRMACSQHIVFPPFCDEVEPQILSEQLLRSLNCNASLNMEVLRSAQIAGLAQAVFLFTFEKF